MLQAAKQELTRQFNAAERERKSRKKSVAEVAQEQRELEIRKKQQVLAMHLYICLNIFISASPARGLTSSSNSFALTMCLD